MVLGIVLTLVLFGIGIGINYKIMKEYYKYLYGEDEDE